MDKETSQVAQEGDKWERFVKSEEWQMVKSRILDKLIQLSDLTLINESQDPVAALMDIKVNKAVVIYLKGFIDEIEGEAHQHEMNKRAFQEIRRDEIIQRYEV